MTHQIVLKEFSYSDSIEKIDGDVSLFDVMGDGKVIYNRSIDGWFI